ncbi:response regulator transcription factor [Ampullimonas aquatilis]|uniref:response regulator transcription factor n=1 Tax=Ampullimonas aquatilis TaxID=1341549 RepID=UPI003C715C77
MRIAILDDDSSQLELVSHVLTGAGHTCHLYSEGKVLLQQLRRETFDMLILDLQVPDLSGDKILAWVREHLPRTMPVLFMTSRTAEDDIVSGLNAGADDYMIKPLRRGELVARVQALLRRAYPTPVMKDVEVFGNYQFDPRLQEVQFNDQKVTLTQKEFDLALLLFRNLARPLSRSHILEAVWGRDIDIPSRTMDTHISRVRTKLVLRVENGFRLSPVYSYGYRLEKITPAVEN